MMIRVSWDCVICSTSGRSLDQIRSVVCADLLSHPCPFLRPTQLRSARQFPWRFATRTSTFCSSAVQLRAHDFAGDRPAGVTVHLIHDPSDRTSILHHRHSRHARLLQGQAWLRVSGNVAGSTVYAIVARDRTRHKARLGLRRRYMRRAVRPHICPDWRWAAQRESESRAAQGLEFVRELANTPWHSREFVVKDCDGRLLAFGSNL